MVSATRSANVASIIAIIAGVLMLLNAAYWIITQEAYGVMLANSSWTGIGGVAAAGAFFGIVVIVGGIELRRSSPENHLEWGAAIALFSALSLPLAGGGFLIGFFLGELAGAIAVRSAGPPEAINEVGADT